MQRMKPFCVFFVSNYEWKNLNVVWCQRNCGDFLVKVDGTKLFWDSCVQEKIVQVPHKTLQRISFLCKTSTVTTTGKCAAPLFRVSSIGLGNPSSISKLYERLYNGSSIMHDFLMTAIQLSVSFTNANHHDHCVANNCFNWHIYYFPLWWVPWNYRNRN